MQPLALNFNGTLHSSEETIFPASNRGYRYGDGCFETILRSAEQMPLLRYHLQRLYRGLALLQITVPQHWTLEFWEEQLRITGSNWSEARLRLTVTRQGEGFYQPQLHTPDFVVEAYPRTHPALPVPKQGLRIGLCSTVRLNAEQVLSNLKTCNALPYVLAGLFVQNHQLDDCLLLNQHERLAEASRGNLVIWQGQQGLTPPLSEGCIDGVMRRWLLENARNLGLQLSEKNLRPDDVRRADEIWCVNAVTGIQWVKVFADRHYRGERAMATQQKIYNLLFGSA